MSSTTCEYCYTILERRACDCAGAVEENRRVGEVFAGLITPIDTTLFDYHRRRIPKGDLVVVAGEFPIVTEKSK